MYLELNSVHHPTASITNYKYIATASSGLNLDFCGEHKILRLPTYKKTENGYHLHYKAYKIQNTHL